MARIYAKKYGKMDESDRLALVTLLAKAGYKVRLGREKTGDSKPWVYFVEYED